jgi:hypothetical protein
MSLMRKLTENRTKQRNTPVLRPRTTWAGESSGPSGKKRVWPYRIKLDNIKLEEDWQNIVSSLPNNEEIYNFKISSWVQDCGELMLWSLQHLMMSAMLTHGLDISPGNQTWQLCWWEQHLIYSYNQGRLWPRARSATAQAQPKWGPIIFGTVHIGEGRRKKIRLI